MVFNPGMCCENGLKDEIKELIILHVSLPYLIFVTNAANAVRVKILAQCKKIPEEPEKYCFWQFCRKFTHFPSVKFS